MTTADEDLGISPRSPVGQALLQEIRKHPGMSLSELRVRFDLGWGNLYHHINQLERRDVIRLELVGRRRLAYPAHDPHRFKPAQDSLLRGRTARVVAEAVARTPGAGVLEISEATGVTPRAVYYHVRRLCQAGLVERASRGRYAGLRPSQSLVRLLHRESQQSSNVA